MDNIGFMQGRLSEPVNGMIQAFPRQYWEKEFELAYNLKVPLMEWTLDQKDLYQNPIMTKAGRRRIKSLSIHFGIQIPSLTGDCFMQSPFWKAISSKQNELKRDFINVCLACSDLSVNLIILPLVDNGSIENSTQEKQILDFLLSNEEFFREKKIQILFESDFDPLRLGKFIERLPKETFGINYDIGNSAYMGFDVSEEFASYGPRIKNVHIKDRLFRGESVPLTAGDADFISVFEELFRLNYGGNFILQTARDKNGLHAEAVSKYRDLVNFWIETTSCN